MKKFKIEIGSIVFINDKERDFNWVKFGTFKANEDGGSDYMIDFDMRIPKNITDLSNIKKYVIDNVPRILKEVLEDFSNETK